MKNESIIKLEQILTPDIKFKNDISFDQTVQSVETVKNYNKSSYITRQQDH